MRSSVSVVVTNKRRLYEGQKTVGEADEEFDKTSGLPAVRQLSSDMQRERTSVLLLLLCLAVQALAADSERRGYVLTAPKRLLAGSTEKLCLTLHNVMGTAHVNIKLLHPDSDDIIASVQRQLSDTATSGSHSCLVIHIPNTNVVVARLHLVIRFDQLYDYIIDTVKEVHIQSNPELIFIETDKPIYKPGQEVKFRVLVLRHDLKPVTQPISKIWIETPSEVHVAQWVDVKTNVGLVQLALPLSHEPQKGIWKIRVKGNNSHFIHTKRFEVREYVLPRFEVTVKPPDYILAHADYLLWKICAKYSYGQPVNGKLHIKVEPQIPTWRMKKINSPEINVNAKLQSDGCYDFNVTGEELGLPNWDIAPNSIVLSAIVNETGTSIVQNVSTTTLVIHQALKLEFVPYSPQFFKPSLPYSGKIKVVHPNNNPASDELIQLCLKVQGTGEWSRTLVICKNFSSDSDGYVPFIVPPQHQNIVLLSFVATAIDYQTKYYSADKKWRVFMDQPTAYFDVHVWYSPSNSYISVVDTDEKSVKCNAEHEFKIYFTRKPNETNHLFHHIVKSRGDLLHVSQHKHESVSRSVNILQGFSNILGSNEDIERSRNGSLFKEDTEIIIDSLNLKVYVQPKMSPTSYLMVYHVRNDGELIAGSHMFQVEKCFPNKVNAKFSAKQEYPGSEVILTIEAAPKSLCAVAAVDKAITFIATNSFLDPEMIFRDMSQFHIDGNSPPRQHDDWEYCSKRQKEMSGKERIPVDENFETTEKTNENGAFSPDKNGTVDTSPEGEPLPPVVAAGIEVEPETQVPIWDLRRKRRWVTSNKAMWNQQDFFFRSLSKYVDSIQAFEDFGAVVLSDLVLKTRPCDSTRYDRAFAMQVSPLAFPLTETARGLDFGYNEDVRQPLVEIRSFFPETWIWELIQMGDHSMVNIKKELPHSVTDWQSSIFCMSPLLGLGVSLPANITAFQPFFLDYVMPYSIKRGEILTLKVVLSSFLPYSLPIKVTLQNTPEIEIVSNSSSDSACVNPQSNSIHEYKIKAIYLGNVNITVTAEVDSLFPEQCGPDMLIERRDTLVKPILVEPEGFPVEKTRTSFICPNNFSEDSTVWWTLELPVDIVEDSARADVKVVGDILGPVLQNLDHLVQLPMGCGEQNMILFVPNLHVINYLNATKQENPVLLRQAIQNMEKGYQRELTFRHMDGSYSAFGNSDPEGSIWLTAFVVKSFAQARSQIFIDVDDLKISMKWVTKQQMENGCFPVIGQVFHKDMKGGLTGDSSSTALTAYILISLLETGLPLSSSVTSNVVYCLKGDKEPDLYTLVLSTYAFALLGEKNLAKEGLRHLLGAASVEQDLMWWEKSESSSKGLSVEMTAYVILSLIKIGGEENLIHSLKAIRWISKHRNANGGFISTQDTIVALEALAKYTTELSHDTTNLHVHVSATELDTRLHIQEFDRLIIKSLNLPVLPTHVEIVADGDGCALVQSSLRYNVKTPSGSDAFELDVKTDPVASVDLCTVQRVEICMRYKLHQETSNMAIVHVSMVTGFKPDRTSLFKLAEDKTLNLKKFEEEKDKVNFYFDEISNKRQCFGFLIKQEIEVENTAPAIVRLYDYYQQELFVEKRYSADTQCVDERLPNPQPDVRIDQVDDMLTSNSSSALNLSVDENTTSLEGFNPQFVDVDHDLDVPTGNEGPDPVFVMPPGAENLTLDKDLVSCPICSDSFPANFLTLYCKTAVAYKLIIRKSGNARLLMDITPGKTTSRIRKFITIAVPEQCKCKPLTKVGNHIVVLDSQARSISVEDEAVPQMRLDGSVHVITVAISPGLPEIVRQARNGC